MSQSSRAELLTLALGVLPALPTTVDVLSEGGGCHVLRLSQVEDDLLHGYSTRSAMRAGLHLLARVYDDRRGRYEIEFEVDESFFHSGQEALVHLAVVGVRHRKARRAAPRVGVSVQLAARVRYGHSMPRDTELVVRLIDISATGLAFVTERELSPGDMFMLAFRLGDRDLRVESRVVRVDPAPYGRYRAGCEIVEISDGDRRAIAALADQSEERGSQDERRPDVVAALADAREARIRRGELDEAPGKNPAVG